MIILICDKNTHIASNLAKTKEFTNIPTFIRLNGTDRKSTVTCAPAKLRRAKTGDWGGQISRYTTKDGKRNNKKPMQEMNDFTP